MTKRTLAALSSAAVLLAAAGCGKNEDAKLDENGRLPVSTQNADNTYTPAPATTSVPSADYDPTEQPYEPEQQYSTVEEPTSIVTWTQEYSVEVYESGHGGGKKSGNGSTTEPPSEPVLSPDDWYNAIDAEYQACGGVTSFVRLLRQNVEYNGVFYGVYEKTLPADSDGVNHYRFTLYSVDKDNNGKILNSWDSNISPTGASSNSVNVFFCNGKFYVYYKSGYGTKPGTTHTVYTYDIEGNLLSSYTLPRFNSWERTMPDYTPILSEELGGICPDGKYLTRNYLTEDAYNYDYRYYIDGKKVPEPTTLRYGYPDTFYPKSDPVVTGMYKNKLYMSFEGLYGEKYHFWLDTDTLEWHELPDDIHLETYYPSGKLESPSGNYAVGRYLFTDDMVYDMEEDKVLFTSAEDERGILSSKKYLYGDRNVVADAEGVTVYPAGGGDGVKVLEWE